MQASAYRNSGKEHPDKDRAPAPVTSGTCRREGWPGCRGPVLSRRLFFFLFFIGAILNPSRLTIAQLEPAWQEQWHETLTAAGKQGKVVVFGPAGELIRNGLGAAFGNSFPGIVFEYAGGRATEQATRIQAERDGGIFSVDVFIGGAVTMMRLGSDGVLESLGSALILPQVKDPKYWRDGRLEYTNPSTQYTLVFSSQPNPPVVYNLKQVRVNDIDELYELLDPKWKGKVVLNDPLPPGTGSSLFRWLWRLLGPDKATTYYREILAQAGAVDRDQRRQIEWIAQGKYAWLLGPNVGLLHQLMQRGLKVGILPEFKDYGTHIGTGAGCIALLQRAPHRNAALVFINWFLGREGQTAWTKAVNLQTRRLDVPPDHVPPYLRRQARDHYWVSYHETDAVRSPQEEGVIKELFGR